MLMLMVEEYYITRELIIGMGRINRIQPVVQWWGLCVILPVTCMIGKKKELHYLLSWMMHPVILRKDVLWNVQK